MQANDFAIPIIQTKLHRPVLPVDLVPRPHLIDWLDARRNRPLTLVSAPAGYGKSTLTSNWLDTCNYPHTWLTLDDGDNDLVCFMTYLIKAIRVIFPEAAKNSQNLLSAYTQPSIKEFAINLINEINQLDQFFVLVLDDFEVIQGTEVLDFLTEFLLHPPHGFHLVLCTRIDPPLPIHKLRAQSQLTEIRAQDLRFSMDESLIFLEKMLGATVNRTIVEKMDQQSEGWVTGLRLAALAVRHRVGKRLIEVTPAANNQYVADYLMSEILEQQIGGVSEVLLKTSILKQFNAGLCKAVCDGKSDLDYDVFTQWLVASNLFTIPLDDHNQWVRYHHLFRDFLQGELVRRYEKAEIATLHKQVSNWFIQNGLIYEAIDHALVAGDPDAAANIIERNRYAILDREEWYVLKKWLALFPDEIKQQRLELMMAKAWVLQFQFALPVIASLMDTIENMLENSDIEPAIWGEIAYFRGWQFFLLGDSTRSLEYLTDAREQIPQNFHLGRGLSETYFSLATQMNGRKETAVKALEQQLYYQDKLYHVSETRMRTSLLLIRLLTGELIEAAREIDRTKKVAQENNNLVMETLCCYFQAYDHYFRDELDQAVVRFTQAVDNRYLIHARAATDNLAGCALTYQVLGQLQKANEIMELLFAFANQSNNPLQVTVALSCQARLALQRGDLTSAVKWLQIADISIDVGIMAHWIEVPRLTKCRVLIAQGTEDSLQQAVDMLRGFRQQNEAQNNTRQLIDILLLQALAYQKQSQTDQALDAFEHAITLAEPGGWIRPFVEIGSDFIPLFVRLVDRSTVTRYIRKLMSACKIEVGTDGGIPVVPTSPLIEPLTNREFEVLELLGKRLTNKEIAVELHITAGTVQQHLNHIYAKLSVKGRRQAVAKATELALLPTRI